MASNKEKHQLAFCVSAVALCAGLSLITTAVMVYSAISPVILVIGGVLTFLSAFQAIESYAFLHNNEKPINKLATDIKNKISGSPESKLFTESILQPFFDVFGKQSREY